MIRGTSFFTLSWVSAASISKRFLAPHAWLMGFDVFLSSLFTLQQSSYLSNKHYECCVLFIITKLMAEVSLGQATGHRAWGSECVRWECGQV